MGRVHSRIGGLLVMGLQSPHPYAFCAWWPAENRSISVLGLDRTSGLRYEPAACPSWGDRRASQLWRRGYKECLEWSSFA